MNGSSPGGTRQPRGGKSKQGDAAFDMYVERGLHKMFDGVANEPIPEEWLKLIEDDRAGSGEET